MPRDVRAYLWDVLQAIDLIEQFTRGRTLADYSSDLLFRSAVERQLGIVGEALKQALNYFPDIEPEIRDCRAIIAVRNRLIHGYGSISDELVWKRFNRTCQSSKWTPGC
jgi:uncharacterized protein with HEPN domain